MLCGGPNGALLQSLKSFKNFKLFLTIPSPTEFQTVKKYLPPILDCSPSASLLAFHCSANGHADTWEPHWAAEDFARLSGIVKSGQESDRF